MLIIIGFVIEWLWFVLLESLLILVSLSWCRCVVGSGWVVFCWFGGIMMWFCCVGLMLLCC